MSCTKTIYESSWQRKTVKADGKLNEWKVPLKHYDYSSKIQYAVSNDSVNMYICIRVADEQTQFKIIRTGMQVWVDSTGKKKQITGVFFPLAKTLTEHVKSDYNDASRNNQQGYQKLDTRILKAQLDRDQKQMHLVGFKPLINGISILQNEYKINYPLANNKHSLMEKIKRKTNKFYTATSYSLNALFKEVFKSVLAFLVPIINAHGTLYSPAANFFA